MDIDGLEVAGLACKGFQQGLSCFGTVPKTNERESSQSGILAFG